jgi:UTP:GlnB (protein PII) uridylyltransferase
MQDGTGIRRDVPGEGVEWFVVGMPEEYSSLHDAAEIAAHAGVVGRREASLVHVELCPGSLQGDGNAWLCVVTDDRPGLLSLLSAAIAAHSLDILAARVYTRTRAGLPDEAVDLFCVRQLGNASGPVLGADLASIRRSMVSLLRGELPVETLERHAADTSRPGHRPETAIYFHSAEPDLLLVETPDHPGLLLEITLTIFRERISIIRSHITTIGGIARDEFQLAEIDGAPLTVARREMVIERLQKAVTRKS